MNKRFLVVLSGMFLCNSLFSQTVWNLRQAIEYAIRNNITVKQANINSLRAEVDFQQNRLGAYPNASFSNNWSMSFGRRENPTTGILQTAKALSSTYNFSS